MSEDTLFLDCHGDPILVGDVIRAPITINQGTHGTWGEYAIRKGPGGYILSYRSSEKGPILPEGYTGGYMTECLPDEDEIDIKSLIFARVPIRVQGWVKVPEDQLAETWAEKRARDTHPKDGDAKLGSARE